MEAVISLPDTGFIISGELPTPLKDQDDVYLARLDSKGEEVWQIAFDHTDDDKLTSIDTFPNGDIIFIANSFGDYPTDKKRILMARVSQNGQLAWEKVFIDPGNEVYAFSVTTLSNGSFAITGEFYDPSQSNTDLLVARFDGSGNATWQKRIFTTMSEEGRVIRQANNGDLIVASLADTIYWTGSPSMKHLMVTRIDQNGTIKWNNIYETNADETPYDLLILPNDDFLISYSRQIANNSEVALLKIDSAGSVLWNKEILFQQYASNDIALAHGKGSEFLVALKGLTNGVVRFDSSCNPISTSFLVNGTMAWGDVSLRKGNGIALIGLKSVVTGNFYNNYPCLIALDSNGIGLCGVDTASFTINNLSNSVTSQFSESATALITDQPASGYQPQLRSAPLCNDWGDTCNHMAVIRILGDATTYCDGPAKAIYSGGWNTASFSWYIDSVYSGSGIVLNKKFTPGTHHIMLTTNSGACADTAYDTIQVFPNPQPTITPSDTQYICPGDTVTFSVPGNWEMVVWYNLQISPTLDITGPSTVNALVIDSNSCQGFTDYIEVLPLSNSFPNINITGNSNICYGDTVILTTGNHDQILWSTGDTTSSIIVTSPGTYSVVVSDTMFCPDSNDITINGIGPTPSITATYGPTTCPGDSVQLSTGSYPSYSWSTGDTTKEIYVDSSGTYFVVVTDNNGCAGISPAGFIVTFDIPVVGFDTMINSKTVQFTDTSTAAVSWHWNFGDGDSSSLQHPSHTYQNFGGYFVCLTIIDTNGCVESHCDSVVINTWINNDEASKPSIVVYPNPADHEILVRGSITLEQIILADNAGRKLMYIPINNRGTARIAIDDLPAGIYNLAVLSKDHHYYSKIAIVH